MEQKFNRRNLLEKTAKAVGKVMEENLGDQSLAFTSCCGLFLWSFIRMEMLQTQIQEYRDRVSGASPKNQDFLLYQIDESVVESNQWSLRAMIGFIGIITSCFLIRGSTPKIKSLEATIPLQVLDPRIDLRNDINLPVTNQRLISSNSPLLQPHIVNQRYYSKEKAVRPADMTGLK